MPWATLIQLLIQFGPEAFELAKKLIANWNNTAPVTLADIQELQDMSKRTSREAMIAALVRSGVALDSPQAVALLALIR